MPHINYMAIHSDNTAYISYSDTDAMTDYFNGYCISSIKRLIEAIKSDIERGKPTPHQGCIHWVNNSDWTAQRKNKVLNRLVKAGVIIKEYDYKPTVYFNLNGLRGGNIFYMTVEGEHYQELDITSPEHLQLTKDTADRLIPSFCGESEARCKFANSDYDYWKNHKGFKDLLPNHIAV